LLRSKSWLATAPGFTLESQPNSLWVLSARTSFALRPKVKEQAHASLRGRTRHGAIQGGQPPFGHGKCCSAEAGGAWLPAVPLLLPLSPLLLLLALLLLLLLLATLTAEDELPDIASA
jgi:hypothetical protein